MTENTEKKKYTVKQIRIEKSVSAFNRMEICRSLTDYGKRNFQHYRAEWRGGFVYLTDTKTGITGKMTFDSFQWLFLTGEPAEIVIESENREE